MDTKALFEHTKVRDIVKPKELISMKSTDSIEHTLVVSIPFSTHSTTILLLIVRH